MFFIFRLPGFFWNVLETCKKGRDCLKPSCILKNSKIQNLMLLTSKQSNLWWTLKSLEKFCSTTVVKESKWLEKNLEKQCQKVILQRKHGITMLESLWLSVESHTLFIGLIKTFMRRFTWEPKMRGIVRFFLKCLFCMVLRKCFKKLLQFLRQAWLLLTQWKTLLQQEKRSSNSWDQRLYLWWNHLVFTITPYTLLLDVLTERHIKGS